jgi:hypothetical protein
MQLHSSIDGRPGLARTAGGAARGAPWAAQMTTLAALVRACNDAAAEAPDALPALLAVATSALLRLDEEYTSDDALAKAYRRLAPLLAAKAGAEEDADARGACAALPARGAPQACGCGGCAAPRPRALGLTRPLRLRRPPRGGAGVHRPLPRRLGQAACGLPPPLRDAQGDAAAPRRGPLR